MLDVAMLFARLESLAETGQIPPKDARAAADEFLEAYAARAPREWLDRFSLNYACALLQLALFALRHQSPEWPDRVGAIVANAARAARPNGSTRRTFHGTSCS